MSDKKLKFCSLCGSNVNIDDSFCNNCGVSLDETVVLDSTIPLNQSVSQTQATPHVVAEKPYVKTSVHMPKVSLIAGAIAFVVSNLPFVRFICIPFCIVSVLFGYIILSRKEKKPGFAIGGIILGVLALASWVTSWFIDWWWYIL
ncbi:MAG: DUF4190 domain-containing protein [Candidatus Heimdallarchaeota archaeon]|nr:DUF4190 domain-containing protein [Candidatus Heimdallarchaeota archaeon]MCK5184795.1 DUF4190 domain-containing protein [Candidatus Heimdallarchaeota archaeon]MCK5297354.1 DUF4190 domain-containing protein [Candidatus Heimdallarchaeota archaeon]